MDPEFADLVPLFIEESRDRLGRFAQAVTRLAEDPEALANARRELHTLKGAGRMLQLPAFAELCHVGEELLQDRRAGTPSLMGTVPLLLRIGDQLSGMVDEVARGGDEPACDPELLALLATMVPSAPPGWRRAAEAPAATAATAEPPVVVEPSPEAAPVEDLPTVAPADAGEAPVVRRGGSGGRRAEIRLDAEALDAVADRATQVRIMALANRQTLERMYEIAQLAEEGVREPQPAQVLAVMAAMLRRMAVELEGGQRRLLRAAEEQLEATLALQMQPLRGMLQGFARYARDLARTLHREVDVWIEGEDTRLDRRIAAEVEEAVLHLVRNAVDHGIEPVEVRVARGKSRLGILRLSAASAGSRVRLVIADDGGGIDARRVLQQAVESNLVSAAKAAELSEDEILRLLFSPGFSTRREVSETSGRGLGLDVVAAAIDRVGGEIFLETVPRKGTTITLSFPVARRGETVVIVRIGQLRLGLPAGALRRAVRLPTGAVVERDGQLLARVGDRLVPFLPLARLFGQAESETQLLIEGTVSGMPFAVAVDGIEREQEVLVRPLPSRLASDHSLEGMALLASGEPVGILAPAVLARREVLASVPAMPRRAIAQRVRVLLVDDSLVTREMERRLLEDAGFEVAAAVDAAEALSRLGEESFDCLVTDIEMPRLDGFELTAQLRAMEQFAHLPIVVVSTRDRPEDRLRGLQAGADAYLTKQSLDAGELVELVRRLSGH